MKAATFSVVLVFAAAGTGCTNVERSRNLADPAVPGRVLAVQVCSACHGVDGNSVSPNFPRLAAQQPGYIVSQLTNFRTHQRSDPSGFRYMWGISRYLTDDQIAGLAEYFSKQKALPNAAGDATLDFVIYPGEVLAWRLEILDSTNAPVCELGNRGAPPEHVNWRGDRKDGGHIQGGAVYRYRLQVDYGDGTSFQSSRRRFGVEGQARVATLRVSDAFLGGSSALGLRGKQALSAIAIDLRSAGAGTIVVRGHADSIGSAPENPKLSRARAEAATNFLVQHEHMPRSRFMVEALSDARPGTSDSSPEGRESDRRIEFDESFFCEPLTGRIRNS